MAAAQLIGKPKSRRHPPFKCFLPPIVKTQINTFMWCGNLTDGCSILELNGGVLIFTHKRRGVPRIS